MSGLASGFTSHIRNELHSGAQAREKIHQPASCFPCQSKLCEVGMIHHTVGTFFRLSASLLSVQKGDDNLILCVQANI